MVSACRPSLLQLAATAMLAVSGVHGVPVSEGLTVRPRDETPALADSDCTWWWENTDDSYPCEEMLQRFQVCLSDFMRWNPSITADCGNYLVGQTYCVIGPSALNFPDCGEVPSDPPSTVTTESAAPTSTGPSNGIKTPDLVQPGIVDNCAEFHFVEVGDTCYSMATEFGVTVQDLLAWNTKLNSVCSNLVAGANACVKTIGFEPSPSKPTGATTTGANGLPTPTAVQPGMVSNCNKYHLVKETTTCQGILTYNGISLADFFKWNPDVGANCENLQPNTNACVGVVGGTTAKPTTTQKPATTTGTNGLPTPTAVQPGMVSNCNKYHLVKETTTCQGILEYNKISLADFIKWNPNVGTNCENLQRDTNACVGVVGGTTAKPVTTTTQKPEPTATKGPNGITTPLPIQPKMVSNCNKWHKISTTTKCSGVLTYNDITLAEFYKWNPDVKSDCSNLQANTNACVNVVGRTPPKPTTTKPAPEPTATKGPNGIMTPLPIQPKMVSNCNKWHKISTTTKCSGVLTYNDITLAEFYKWNPDVKSDCSNLQANTNACVNVVGRTLPKPTTTKPAPAPTVSKGANGIKTPLPIQTGMTKSCTKFHSISKTTTCQALLDYHKITKAQFVKWNPDVGSNCDNLWVGTSACVDGP